MTLQQRLQRTVRAHAEHAGDSAVISSYLGFRTRTGATGHSEINAVRIVTSG